MSAGSILLGAGGTGGHVFPAEALAAELLRRGRSVAFVTDRRGQGFGKAMPEVPLHRIAAGTPTGKKLTGKMLAGLAIARGTLNAFLLLRRLRPLAVVGFGGYPSLPLMLAATQSGVPTLIHEQNAVLGRVNRLVARRADAIALSFADTRFVPSGAQATLTGNPVRPAILALAGAPYAPPDSAIHLLVLGGSQGARVFSDVLPAALGQLPEAIKARLHIVQQCRPEDLDAARAAYAAAGLAAETATFFPDVAARLAAAHLVVSRAGASTTAEIAAIGRPALLVPYAFATDDHQTANAAALVAAGGAIRIAQGEFTPQRATAALGSLLADSAALRRMAAAAATVGRPQAAVALADLVDRVVRAHRGLGAVSGEADSPGQAGMQRSRA